MELTNDFQVSVPVEQAWSVLTDVERIAPCLPGAELREIQGDEYRGAVKVKVGPITAEYRGKASFIEKDDASRRAVLRAEGRETRGQGNASATITASLEPSGDRTRVSVMTDLAVTGRVAQFGRGVLADVSTKLLDQFVDSLESTVLAGGATAAGTSSAGTTQETAPANPAGRSSADAGSAPVDLLEVAGGSVAKRAAPVAAGLALVGGLVWLVRRRLRK